MRMSDLGHAPYRGDQVFGWIWQKHAHDFAIMTNISKETRAAFAERFYLWTNDL